MTKRRARKGAATTAKQGKRVAKPKRRVTKKPDLIGMLEGVFRIVGDIKSPVVPPEAWEYD